MIDSKLVRCAELLGDYLETGSTATLREAAKLVVQLRQRHTLNSGLTDWSGRSSGYREDIRWVYSEAGIPDEELDTVQAALRYHVGNLLREKAPADELDGVGLQVTSPRERLAKLRRDSAWRRNCRCECTCGAKELPVEG